MNQRLIILITMMFQAIFWTSSPMLRRTITPMRLLIIADIEEEHIGGTEEVIRQIKKRLLLQNCNVRVMDMSELDTIQLPFLHGEPFTKPWGIKKHVAAVFKEFQPDYILIALMGPLSTSAADYCAEHEIPFTAFCSVRLPEISNIVTHIPCWITKYFIVNKFLSQAHHILVPTDSFKRELAIDGFANVTVWPHGIDLGNFPLPTKELKHQLVKALQLEGLPHPFYLYVGHLSKIKNLQAFLDLEVPGTKIVVGDENIGFSLAELKENYPEIIFTGPQRGINLLAYYHCADIFMFPSKNDSFGLVILEALACGLPIVANNDEELGLCARWAWRHVQAGVIKPEDCRRYAARFSWETSIALLLNNLEFINPDIYENLDDTRYCCC